MTVIPMALVIERAIEIILAILVAWAFVHLLVKRSRELGEDDGAGTIDLIHRGQDRYPPLARPLPPPPPPPPEPRPLISVRIGRARPRVRKAPAKKRRKKIVPVEDVPELPPAPLVEDDKPRRPGK